MSLVDDTFGPGGYLSTLFPGYEPRAQQVELAREIDRAIRAGESLLAEAPTSVGKSLAYLVPAIRHAVESNSRVLVVTANIVLQEQLVRVDLPRLKQILPVEFDFGLAKGRSNYLCLSQLDDSTADRALMGSRHGEEGLDAIVEWAAETKDGDISELPFEPSLALRRLFTITAEECLGKACPRNDDCFPNRARARLSGASVIVANYHLFFSDLIVRAATDGEAGILPAFDVLIADEAHRMAEIARDFFGFRHTAGSVRWATRLLSGAPGRGGRGEIPAIDPGLKDLAQAAAERFFSRLAAHARSDDYKARLRDEDPAEAGALLFELERAAAELERAAATYPLDAAGRKKLRQGAASCERIARHVRASTRPDGAREVVFYVELDRASGKAAICAKPIEVDRHLRAAVFEAPGIRSAIATSATLTTGDGSFDFVAGEIGAEKARELAVSSPFDFAGRCLFVVPGEFDVCLPGERAFVEESAGLFARVASLARGRTLGLFTTHRTMRRAFEVAVDRVVFEPDATKDPLGRAPRILCQGQMPRSELVRLFKEDVSSVLVGTASLWEGVDVPGEALSCVVMDKLPFPPPDDPVLDALDARDRDAFSRHSLPRALIAFRQGWGRLIRSATDRGVVVCLDRRIVEKPYGRKFLKALPLGVRLSRDLEDVRRFLDEGTVAREMGGLG